MIKAGVHATIDLPTFRRVLIPTAHTKIALNFFQNVYDKRKHGDVLNRVITKKQISSLFVQPVFKKTSNYILLIKYNLIFLVIYISFQNSVQLYFCCLNKKIILTLGIAI